MRAVVWWRLRVLDLAVIVGAGARVHPPRPTPSRSRPPRCSTLDLLWTRVLTASPVDALGRPRRRRSQSRRRQQQKRAVRSPSVHVRTLPAPAVVPPVRRRVPHYATAAARPPARRQHRDDALQRNAGDRGTMPGMGLLTEDPVPPGFTGTRIGVCNLCEAICGIELTIEDGAVTGIRGNEADPLSRGYICPKGVSMADVHDDPDRLRRPIRRVGQARRDLGGDRLGRGARPGRRPAGRDRGGARPGRDRRLPRQPQRPLARLRDPRRAVREEPAHPQPVQRLDGGPDPAPVRGVAAVRPPAAAAGPGHRPDVVLPGPRRQPDGVQRLADDRARLPAAGPRPQGRAAAGWSCSTPGAPRRPRSRPSTTSSGPGSDAVRAAGDAARAARRGARHAAGVRRQRGPGRRAGRRVHPRAAPPRASGVPAGDHPAAGARLRRGRVRGGVRPDGRVHARASGRCASGRSSCSTC